MNRNNMRVMRKERRRDRRRPLNLEARLNDHDVVLTDLSASGFGVALDATDRAPFDFRVGQRMYLELALKNAEARRFTVEIARSPGQNGVLGGVFVDLTDDGYNFIEGILTGRLQRRR